MGPRAAVQRDIDSGALVVLAERETVFGYFIVTPTAKPPDKVRTFIDWLKRAA